MLNEIFRTTIEITLAVSVVILVLLALTPVLNKRYVSKWRYWVWMILAVRLIVPINMTLPKAPIKLETPIQTVTYMVPSTWISQQSAQQEGSSSGQKSDQQTVVPTIENTVTKVPIQPTGQRRSITVAEILTILWISGMFLFSLWQVVAYWKFNRFVRRWSRPIISPNIQDLFCQLMKELKILSRVRLKTNEKVLSPMMVGIIRPTILLPHENYTDKDLYFILKHELIHHKRHDIAYKLLMLAANAVHWFNPFVWGMVRQANKDIEISCDDAVVAGISSDERGYYCDTIMAVVRSNHQGIALSTNFYGGKKVIKERFQNILNTKKKRRGFIAILVLLVCTVFIGGFIAITQENNKDIVDKETDKTTDRKEIVGQIDKTYDKTEEVSETIDVDPEDIVYYDDRWGGFSLSIPKEILGSDDARTLYVVNAPNEYNGITFEFILSDNNGDKLETHGTIFKIEIYNTATISADDIETNQFVGADKNESRDVIKKDELDEYFVFTTLIMPTESSEFDLLYNKITQYFPEIKDSIRFGDSSNHTSQNNKRFIELIDKQDSYVVYSHNRNFKAEAWSPDDSKSVVSYKGIHILELLSGKVIWEKKPGYSDQIFFWSEDDHYLAIYGREGDRGETLIIDVKDGSVIPVALPKGVKTGDHYYTEIIKWVDSQNVRISCHDGENTFVSYTFNVVTKEITDIKKVDQTEKNQRANFFDLAIENRIDYVPGFTEGNAPVESPEYLYYAYLLNPEKSEDFKMTKKYVDKFITSHFEVDQVIHKPFKREWDFDGKIYTGIRMTEGYNTEPICELKDLNTYTENGRKIYDVTFVQHNFGEFDFTSIYRYKLSDSNYFSSDYNGYFSPSMQYVVYKKGDKIKNGELKVWEAIREMIAEGDTNGFKALFGTNHLLRLKYYIDDKTDSIVYLEHTNLNE